MVLKKIEVQDAICNTLLGGELSYNKLWDEVYSITRCAIATFNKHLMQLAGEGTIKRIAQKDSQTVIYKVSSDQIDKTGKLKPLIEQLEKILKEQCKSFEEIIVTYQLSSKEEAEDFKKDPKTLDGLASGIINIYHSSTKLSFFNTSGLLPRITKKHTTIIQQTTLQSLERVVERLKTIDPEFHKRLCSLIIRKLTVNT